MSAFRRSVSDCGHFLHACQPLPLRAGSFPTFGPASEAVGFCEAHDQGPAPLSVKWRDMQFY